MEVAANHAHPGVLTVTNEWEQSYKPLPFLFFGLLILWITLLSIWTFNTWSKRRWQTSNLQWVLTTVPVLKSLVVGLSFAFWYSCLNLSMCSFWIAFGVFVTRIFFETSCFVAFLLISHGYCIMHEQLSVADRRSIAGLASVLYIALTGYRAAVPQFAVLVVLIYLVLLYVIFLHVSRNLISLQEQLQHIQDEGVHIMHTAVHTKYMMFKKFQGVMVIMIVAEVLVRQQLMMHGKANGAANYYWMRSLVHEWTEIGIFVYVGWIFRSRDISPYFSVVPSVHVLSESSLPPIFKLEMNEKDFHGFHLKDWHIGVPTSLEKGEANHLPTVVLVQNPSISSMEFCASQDKLASVKHLAYSPFDVISEVKESNLVACTRIFRASIRSLVSCEADFNNMSKNKPSRERKIIDGNMAGSRRDDTALFVKELSDI